MKCSGCRIVAHISCIPQMKFLCRPTFWDGDLRQYRENTTTTHHWVHRRSQTGKCQNCSKVKKNKNKPNTVLELRLINANGSKDHFEVKQPSTIINSFLYWFYVFIFRKSFQSKLSFGSKEIVAISCSWCKAAYHNKENCFNIDRLKEPCSLGEFSFCS